MLPIRDRERGRKKDFDEISARALGPSWQTASRRECVGKS